MIIKRRRFMLPFGKNHTGIVKMLKSGDATQYLAFSPVGFSGAVILFHIAENKDFADGVNNCYFADLFVKPKFRHKGIGGKLMKRIMIDAKKQGFKYLYCGVYCDNEIGCNWYLSMGFEDTGDTFFQNPVFSKVRYKKEVKVLRYIL